MDKDQSHMTGRLITLSLEIIYLLSGEDYTVVKKTSDKYVTPSSRPPHESGGWSRSPSPIMEPSPHSLIPDKSTMQEVLALINKMIDLLSGEDDEDVYQNITMDDQRPLTSPDGSREQSPPGRCPSPLCAQDSPEDLSLPRDHQVMSMETT
ncbi:uncharacterized protein RB166_018208 [Leptodactylus fuscus]